MNEINRIFSKCTQLEKIYFTTSTNNSSISPNGDELLRIISNFSPMTLREFSFGDNWNFSVNGLRKFLEDWRNRRVPLKLIHYCESVNTWTNEHTKIMEMYKNEGVIRY